ncbi:hypothetical protein [Streptomyces sp. NBC_01803]|uniref:hypothetical protein n=1 Tax=Streptomyces sp. NBC_01803 TaxID=2975946 RepID=UPI002DDA46BE|nr:hypothetical protein [Streptomyces sp. NBC_01803]WSA47420.1 hypothetical protein OIE51_26565 [Streptomyces sp. NBC_01803]
MTGEEVIALPRQAAAARPGPATDVNQRSPGELTAALPAGDLDVGRCRAMAPVPVRGDVGELPRAARGPFRVLAQPAGAAEVGEPLPDGLALDRGGPGARGAPCSAS